MKCNLTKYDYDEILDKIFYSAESKEEASLIIEEIESYLNLFDKTLYNVGDDGEKTFRSIFEVISLVAEIFAEIKQGEGEQDGEE